MALVDVENPTAIRDHRLLGLFQFWHGELRGRRMPASADLDSSDMARWTDNLMLVDIPGDFLEFRIRSVGAKVSAMFATRRAGTGLEAMTWEAERRAVLPQYRIVFDTAMPAYYETEHEISEKGLVCQRKLLLPLSEGGERVDAILAGIYLEFPRKGRTQPPKRPKAAAS